MNAPLLLLYIASIFMLIITPGPVVAVVVETAARHGRKQAIYTSLGSNMASLCLIAVAALAIAGTLTINATLFTLISLAGCFYLAAIALHALWAGRLTMLDEVPAARCTDRGFLRGFMVGIANPKDIIFFMAFFPQFINVTRAFGSSMAVLSAVWVTMDLLILTTYVFLVRGAFMRRYRPAIGVASSTFLLIIAAVGFAYTLFAWVRL
ncbi:LysE family translocator [Gibbsiella quercinecans]|uniref:LysE family translocator n=1 Tax=Gibbsiella quercinecans TaxID=929813 RepID=UPI003A4E0582